MSQISIADLIQTYNPFSEFTVRTQDIWNDGFQDEPSLNAHASDAVFQAIEDLQNKKRKVVGITLRAEKGLGKSHIISRIRHRIQEMGNAIFIYMGDYGNLNDVRSEFLKTLVISLKHTGSKNVTQWQELATDLLNDVYQKKNTPQQLIGGLPKKLAKNLNFVGDLTDQVCLRKPEISDPSIIQAILWTLSPVHSVYATRWLSGANLPSNKADQLSLPNSSQDDRTSESFTIACEILSLISQYKSIVICFDQLEGTEQGETGFTKAQVAANLGMDLYNNISRGVLLTAVYPDVWSHQIRVLSAGEAVMDRIGEHIIDLKAFNADDVIALVKKRLSSFYQQHQVTPPHDLYPFDENDLRDKGKQRATARDVLQWCCKNWKSSDVTTDGTGDITLEQDFLVENAYKKELESIDMDDFIDHKVKLSRAIGFGFESLIGQTLEGVNLLEVDYTVAPRSSNKGYIDFRIVGTEDLMPVKIGVAIIQYPTGISVQAGLSRLVDYQRYDLTRGCLLRSRDISPGAARAHQLKNDLIDNMGGEWPEMNIEDVKSLVAIRAVFEARDDYGLTEEMIQKFITKTELTLKNALLLEVLSDPSGQIPNNLLDEDTEIIPTNIGTAPSLDQSIDDLDIGGEAA